MNTRIECAERNGRWIARAFSDDGGDVFGVECSGATAHEAAACLRRWLDWQRDHTAALEALQQAERAYHRTIAGSAFVVAADNVSAVEQQKDALHAVEAARVRLDEIRARKPDDSSKEPA